MNYKDIKNRIEPCGLHCGKCFAFSEGDISKYSKKLKNSFGNFDAHVGRFVDLIQEPVFKMYPEFKLLLTYFSIEDCEGCRKEQCRLFKGCLVRECHIRKGVDFCFQCSEFPCNKTGFDEHLHKRSVNINNRMKEVGVEENYNEIKDKPRY